MKNIIVLALFIMGTTSLQAQEIKALLQEYNQKTVPYIEVQNLKKQYQDYTILDTRKKNEYDVSHLPGAIWVGEKLDSTLLKEIQLDLEKPIVVYCSVGIRSEDYGEELLNAGFENVFNLHGSIFSWKDAGFNVVDMDGKDTQKVHVFSKEWKRYLKTGKKVY